MARVEVKAQAWGYVVDRRGRPRSGQLCDIDTTVYVTASGGTTIPPASWVTDDEGYLPGFVDQGTYTFTDPDGDQVQVEAATGTGTGPQGPAGPAGPSGGPYIDARDALYAGGVQQNGKYITVSMTSGSAVVNHANFVADDVGKTILVPEAGASGDDLITEIVSVTPGVSATLDDTASSTVTSTTALYGTNDSPAWQAAIDTLGSLEARGGRIVCPAPPPGAATERLVSVLAEQLDMTNLRGGSIEGTADGGVAFPVLGYLPDTGAAIQVDACFNTTVEGLSIWTHATDFSAGYGVKYTSSGADNMNCRLQRCSFQYLGVGTAKAAAWVQWSRMIFSSIKGCSFANNLTGPGIELGPAFVNACTIDEQNVFNRCRYHLYMSSGDVEVLEIRGNTFEPTFAGDMRILKGGPSSKAYRLSFKDNWIGDSGLGGGYVMQGIDAHIGGCEVSGNFISGIGAPYGLVFSTSVAGSGSANEVQQVVVVAESGTFQLTFEGQTTGSIAYNASASAVQTALEGLSNVDPGDVDVVKEANVDQNAYTVTFQGALGLSNRTQMTEGAGTALDATGAMFSQCGGGPWEIHQNYIAGSGAAMFDQTTGDFTSLSIHDNGLGVSTFARHATMNDLAGGANGQGYHAYSNLHHGGNVVVPETRNATPYRTENTWPYTLENKDLGTTLTAGGAPATKALTIPTKAAANGGVGFPPGSVFEVVQSSSATPITISGAALISTPAGYTLKTRGDGARVKLQYVDYVNDVWRASGDLEPSQVSTPYTVTNVTTDRTYDANSTTTDELADVLGTLIADLKAGKVIG